MKDIKLQIQKIIEDILYYDKENAIDGIIKIELIAKMGWFFMIFYRYLVDISQPIFSSII